MTRSAYFIAALCLWAETAVACDLCGIYTAADLAGSQADSFSAGAYEQFTSFRTLLDDGHKVSNSAHESMSSAVTQVYGRYDFTDSLGLQLTVPYISRSFRRNVEGTTVPGSESGLGDVSTLVLYTPVKINDGDFLFRVKLRGGLKLPTGNSDRLFEETEEGDEHTERVRAPDQTLFHSGHAEESAETPSGVHGHDLALGSGSFDYVVGAGMFVENGLSFASLDVQYFIRTEGDFDYRYQNDFLWALGAGRYLLSEDEHTLSLRVNLSGEYKGTDVFEGNRASDTGINSIFLGPELAATFHSHLSLSAAVDLPVLRDNTDLQLVPDYRFRFGVTYRF